MSVIFPPEVRRRLHRIPRAPFVLNAASADAHGLVGWWPMINDPAGFVRDYSAFGRDFSYSAAGHAGTKLGGLWGGGVAMSPTFNAVSQYAQNAANAYGNDNDMTVCCRIKRTGTPDSFGRYIEVGGFQVGGGLSIEGSGTSTANLYYWRASTQVTAFAAITLTLGQWHSIVMISSNVSGGHQGYQDGAFVGSNAAASRALGSHRFTIGGWNNGPTSNNVHMQFCDLRIYHGRIADPAEFAARYHDPATAWDLAHELGRVTWFVPTAAGGVLVTPASAEAEAAAIAPAVQFGSITATPAAAEAVGATVAPTVVLGALTISPASAEVDGSALAGTVLGGGLTIAPASAEADGAAVAPSIVFGATAATPAAAEAEGAAVQPLVVLGSVTVAPGAAEADTAALLAAVVEGAVVVTPAAAIALAAINAPLVQLGSVTIVADEAAAEAVGVNPGVIAGGGVLVVPSAAIAEAAGVNPDIAYGAVSVTPATADAKVTARLGNVEGGGAGAGDDSARKSFVPIWFARR